MRSKLSMLVSVFALSTITHAGVVITGTRIIFPSNQSTVTVQLNNQLKQPALIQSWLDDGDPSKIPSADKIPFILTPPITMIEGNKGQMIRLVSKGTETLPKDRESLFWFNILDIPPTTETAQNQLNISIRSRIKVFYRPTKLNMVQEKAFTSVKFSYNEADKTLKINNPSPYFLNFLNLDFNPQKEHLVYTDPLMIAPFSESKIQPKLNFKPTQMIYTLINDYGSNQPYTIDLK
ncbi:molecular chaperone [Acinetobacter sp. MD2(2019)]|uniref:fimbrial biogenesis chaperone n=1 Tax=Acinetobacter sp. MD2(2019) TaxID=2605273 RepID=UPI002D1F2D21|nr:fimbria/pilus periplasmic chaperone [Acinetobacter sp. MD2(2019)]MEB3754355.1 fimbria/pilus periplasmic chaperone [Acinetobacter sp. MD2(2019)]